MAEDDPDGRVLGVFPDVALRRGAVERLGQDRLVARWQDPCPARPRADSRRRAIRDALHCGDVGTGEPAVPKPGCLAEVASSEVSIVAAMVPVTGRGCYVETGRDSPSAPISSLTRW
jgi:hypothetical protein